ncbi:response regulator transcription factor [Mycolicibacterium smegmatis]|uniref:response regulator transcription factor n=1 Tax=Mycolicibacterium smegmatis TaxID=1772 RepID=UPI001303BFD0|nr:response regulator transcription factor [Mycolicibacterium smegmatis]
MIQVVVADDNALIRAGVVRLLEREGIAVVDVACDADQLLASVDTHTPDVVITDIQMPSRHGRDGLGVAITLRQRHPGIGVLVLSQYCEEEYALSLVGDRAEGVGYLLKEKMVEPDVLHDAVRRIAAGGSVLDPDVIARLAGRPRPGDRTQTLTPREHDVLRLMAAGLSNAGIAGELIVSVAAVERHVTSIFSKLGLYQEDTEQHRRVAAVLAFLDGSASR